MKKGETRLLIFGSILLLILLLNSFVYNAFHGIYMPIFLLVVLAIFKIIFGFEKSEFRVTKVSILDTLIVLLIFFLLYYLSGLIISFVKTGNYFTVNGFKDYILPAIFTSIFREVLRYNYLVKADKNKKLVFLSFLVCLFIDISYSIYYGTFSDSMHNFKFLALSLLPAVSFNLYATYVSMYAGYKSVILFSIMTKVYMYIIPITPNADEYLTSIINFLLPIIVLYRLYNTVKNENDEEIDRNYNKKDYISLIISAVVVSVLVYFSSGYFKYHAIAIATGSMSPNILRGDVVIVKKSKDYEHMSVGEVIAYDYHNVLVVHRISKKVKVDNEYYFYSKGDANEEADNYIIKQDMIEGIVKVRIPFIGMPTVWLNELWEE